MSKKRKVRVTSESFVFVSPFFQAPVHCPKRSVFSCFCCWISLYWNISNNISGLFLRSWKIWWFLFWIPSRVYFSFWFCWVLFSVHICLKTQFYLFIFFLLQFVADGVFFAELNELLTRELAEDGYSGVEVRVTPMRTEIIIRATRTQNVLGMISAHFWPFLKCNPVGSPGLGLKTL